MTETQSKAGGHRDVARPGHEDLRVRAGFEEAAANGIGRADMTLKDVTSAWIEGQTVAVGNATVDLHRVGMKLTFGLED